LHKPFGPRLHHSDSGDNNVLSNRRQALVVTAAFVIAACAKKDSATADTTAAGAASAATAVASSAPAGEPSANDVSNYDLNMDRMRKWVAAMKGFSAEAQRDSTAAAAIAMDAGASTAQMIAGLERNPIAKRVLRQAGLSARDYVWTTAAYMQAAMTAGVMEMPNAKAPEGMNMKNIEFVKAHNAELEKMMKEAGMAEGR
jgi:hypothetical protein